MLAICLTAASTWPRKATHGCFHVFAWYRTKSDRHVLRRIILKPKQKIVPTTDYEVPTKKIKYVCRWKIKSNNPHVHIHTISYEYECLGSARTPVTKSSTRDHTASLFCFIQDRSIPRSLQRWLSMKSSISQLTLFYFTIIAIEKPYTTARILEDE